MGKCEVRRIADICLDEQTASRRAYIDGDQLVIPKQNVGKIYRATGQSQLFAKTAVTDSAKLLSSLIYFFRSSFGTKNALQLARMFEVSVG